MLGAIIGDVAGSYYEVLEVQEVKQKRKRSYEERIKILDKKTPLFQENSSCTDDSFLTYSIYDAIKNNDQNYEKYLTIACLNSQELNYADKDKMLIADNDLLMVMDGASSGDVYYSDYGIVGSTLARVDITNNQYIWQINYQHQQ